jgi:hypothetical protein
MSQALAMLLSMAIEAALAAALSATLRWGSAVRAAVAAVLGTLLTHWCAWTTAPWLMAAIGVIPGFIVVEAVVTMIEAGVYCLVLPTRLGRAALLSLAANAGSAGAGVVLAAFNLL